MAAATTDPRHTTVGAYRSPEPACSLAEVLDRILHLGVSLEGNVTISVADVDLLYLDRRLLLASVDTVWPQGRPTSCATPGSDRVPVPPLLPLPPPDNRNPPSRAASIEEPIGAGVTGAGRVAPSVPPAAPAGPVAGLVRLVLTLVKVLHDVLERQAVRRMDGGNLTPVQIEAVGAGLQAQAAEIESLRRHFGFPEHELALNLGLSDRPI
jgi:hypothetical protein